MERDVSTETLMRAAVVLHTLRGNAYVQRERRAHAKVARIVAAINTQEKTANVSR